MELGGVQPPLESHGKYSLTELPTSQLTARSYSALFAIALPVLSSEQSVLLRRKLQTPFEMCVVSSSGLCCIASAAAADGNEMLLDLYCLIKAEGERRSN
jgi:hypothetical protein